MSPKNRESGPFGKLLRHLRRKTIAGFLLMIPAVATVYIVYKIFAALDAVLPSMVNRILPIVPQTWIPGIGIVVLLLIAYLLGLLAANYAGRRLLRGIDGILARIPLFSKIYQTMRQIVEAVAGDKKKMFEKVVLVQFPHTGARTLGFLTSEISGEIAAHVGDRPVTVFVPTSPAPTQGFILMVPSSSITPLSMSAESALKMIMSAGALTPPGPPPSGVPPSGSRD